MRVTAFALRSALAGSNAAATNESTLIAFEVIYSTGFFGLLYSAYTLVLERCVPSNFCVPSQPSRRR